MIRQHVVPKSLQGEKYFRWRGGDVSRLEALADAVFALCLTLLVVSLEIPRTYGELMATFEQVPAFAVCAAILMMCWYFHYLYHRRYGLEDFPAVVLDVALLFVILIYVYPMKFLFTELFRMLFGLGGAGEAPITGSEWPTLMITYSAGFVGIFLIFALMEYRAYRKRDALELDRREVEGTLIILRSHLISAGVGLLSILIVAIRPSLYPWAGTVYFLVGPLQGLNGWIGGVRVERMEP